MLMPWSQPVIQQILNWYGIVGVLTAPLLVGYYLYRLNRGKNPWKFADMLMTKNKHGEEKADLSKFGTMIALFTGTVTLVYTAVTRSPVADGYVTLFITFLSIFSGVQVANGALRVWDDKVTPKILTNDKE